AQGVARLDQAGGGGEEAVEFSVGVGGVPAGGVPVDLAGGYLAVVHQSAGEKAHLEGGGIDQGLEDGAHLAVGGESPVEGAVAVVASSHQGAEGAGAVVHHGDGPLEVGGVVGGLARI